MPDQSHASTLHQAEMERITREYRHIEALLKQAEQGENLERYGELSILYVDPTTSHILEVNTAVIDFLGYDRETLLKMDIHALEVHPPEHANSMQMYVQNGLEERIYTCAYKHADGYARTVKVYQRTLPREGRMVLHYRLEDLSVAHQLWRELQRREDSCFKFQEKLKTLNEIMLELSHIESFDKLCEQIVQLGTKRLGFDRLGLWFLDRDKQMMMGSYGVDERGELRPEHDVSWSYLNTSIEAFINGKTEATVARDDQPIYNDRSEIIGYGWHMIAPLMHGNVCVGVVTADNYLRKQAIKNYEAELLRQYGLAVGQLTELLRTRQQAITLQLIEKQNKMLQKFVRDVGHDFRTPLSIISTKSFLIRRVEDPAQKSNLAQDIQQQVMTINTMLTHMSEYLELTYGQEMHREPTALRNFVQSIIDGYRDQSQYAHVQWQVKLEYDATVVIDRHYIGQALGEIIKNAIQYTLSKNIIRVNLLHTPDEIGIQIHDNGVGIDAKDLPHIFEPLYRADEARTERRSGLGLTVSKSIVEAHGGRIIAESIVGVGSTFTVWLPYGATSQAEHKRP